MVSRVAVTSSPRRLIALATPQLLHDSNGRPSGFVKIVLLDTGYMVIWRDRRADNPGLYYRIILSNGDFAVNEQLLFPLESTRGFSWMDPLSFEDGSQQLRWKVKNTDTTSTEWWAHIAGNGDLRAPAATVTSGYTPLRFSTLPGSLLLVLPDHGGRILRPDGTTSSLVIPKGQLTGSYILRSDTGLIRLRDNTIEFYHRAYDSMPERSIRYPIDSQAVVHCGVIGEDSNGLIVKQLFFKGTFGSHNTWGWVYTRTSRLSPSDSVWLVSDSQLREMRPIYGYDDSYRVHYWIQVSSLPDMWTSTTMCDNIQQANADFRVSQQYEGASTWDESITSIPLRLSPPGAVECGTPAPQVMSAYKRWNDTSAVAVQFTGVAGSVLLQTPTAGLPVALSYILPCFVSSGGASSISIGAVRSDKSSMTMFTAPAITTPSREVYRAPLNLFTDRMDPYGIVSSSGQEIRAIAIHRLPGTMLFTMTGSRDENYLLNGHGPAVTHGQVLAARAAMAGSDNLLPLIDVRGGWIDVLSTIRFGDQLAFRDPGSGECTIEYRAGEYYSPPSFTYLRLIVTANGTLRRQFTDIQTGAQHILTPLGGDTILQGYQDSATIATPGRVVRGFRLPMDIEGASCHRLYDGTLLIVRIDSLLHLDRFTPDGALLQFRTLPRPNGLHGLSVVQRRRDGAIALVFIQGQSLHLTLLSSTLRPVTVDSVMGAAGSAGETTAAFFNADTLLLAWEDLRHGGKDIYAMSATFPDVPSTTRELDPGGSVFRADTRSQVIINTVGDIGIDSTHNSPSDTNQADPPAVAKPHKDELEIWPLPCRNTIEGSARIPIACTAELSLVNSQGEVVQEWHYWMSAGMQRLRLDLATHRVGWYMLVLRTPHTTLRTPVIIE